VIAAGLTVIGLAVGACGGGSDEQQAEDAVDRLLEDAADGTIDEPIDTDGDRNSSVIDACDLVTVDDAAQVMGVPAQRDEESSDPISDTNCHYINVPPVDETEGQVLRQLQVSVYSGAQYFDTDGIVFPTNEREELDIGDDAFVHLSDGLLGLTIQVVDGDVMYSVNYVESAILSDDEADTAGKRPALVALVEDKLG